MEYEVLTEDYGQGAGEAVDPEGKEGRQGCEALILLLPFYEVQNQSAA